MKIGDTFKMGRRIYQVIDNDDADDDVEWIPLVVPMGYVSGPFRLVSCDDVEIAKQLPRHGFDVRRKTPSGKYCYQNCFHSKDGGHYIRSTASTNLIGIHIARCYAHRGPPQIGQRCVYVDGDASNPSPENLQWAFQDHKRQRAEPQRTVGEARKVEEATTDEESESESEDEEASRDSAKWEI